MQKMHNGGAMIVPEPVMRPNRCAIVPQVSRDPGGFVDTGVKLPGFEPRVYVSATGARELARAFEFPTPEQHAQAVTRGDRARARVKQLESEIERLQRHLAAFETLAADGVDVRAVKRTAATRGRAKAT